MEEEERRRQERKRLANAKAMDEVPGEGGVVVGGGMRTGLQERGAVVWGGGALGCSALRAPRGALGPGGLREVIDSDEAWDPKQ